MVPWKQKLYDQYVQTGQSGINQNDLSLSKNPYIEKIIKTHLVKDKKIAILDLGCGYGRILFSLKKNGYQDIYGIDTSAQQIEMAHRFGITEAKHQSIEVFFKENTKSYDVIFLMDILEHLNKADLFDLIEQVYQIMKPNAQVIIHIPNAEGIFGMQIRYGDFTHEQAFTPNSMQQILTALGFQDITCLEDKPIIHGLKSFIRFLLWETLTLPFRALLTAETGMTKHILSQNMLVIAKRK